MKPEGLQYFIGSFFFLGLQIYLVCRGVCLQPVKLTVHVAASVRLLLLISNQVSIDERLQKDPALIGLRTTNSSHITIKAALLELSE